MIDGEITIRERVIRVEPSSYMRQIGEWVSHAFISIIEGATMTRTEWAGPATLMFRTKREADAYAMQEAPKAIV